MSTRAPCGSRNVVETAVIDLAERGVRSSVVRIANIAHSTTDRAGFLCS